MDESLFQAKMVEQVWFGNSRKVMVDLYTDYQLLIDSIASSKQVQGKINSLYMTTSTEFEMDETLGDWNV